MSDVLPPDRTPTPRRLVKLRGALDKDSARRLIQEIKTLRKQSPDPITIVINSYGGQVEAFLLLEKLFNDSKSCPAIITSASQAVSAAACLLVAGHHAAVKKRAKILFHGARVEPARRFGILRREEALALVTRLDRQNRIVAKIMAKQVVVRMTARYLALNSADRNKFPAQNPWIFFKKFADRLQPLLSSKEANRVLYESLDRLKLILALNRHYPTKKAVKGKNFTSVETRLYKAAIDFEAQVNRGHQWSLGPTASAELMIDYLLARGHLRGEHFAVVDGLVRDVGRHFCSTAELRKFSYLKKTSPARAATYLRRCATPRILCFWYFASTLCHRLLCGENTLPAKDAYWLGLVDEVLGKKKSPIKAFP